VWSAKNTAGIMRENVPSTQSVETGRKELLNGLARLVCIINNRLDFTLGWAIHADCSI
jgi:hypothetical protein